MSIIEYENDSKTGRNLSAAAAALLLVAGTNLAYADEIFIPSDFPSAYIEISKPFDFDLTQSEINQYVSPDNIKQIDEEIAIDLKMPPIKSYKRKVKILKRVHATPKLNISELI